MWSRKGPNYNYPPFKLKFQTGVNMRLEEKPYRRRPRIEDAPKALSPDMVGFLADAMLAPLGGQKAAKRATVSAQEMLKDLPLPKMPKDVEMAMSTIPAGYLVGMALNVPMYSSVSRLGAKHPFPEKSAWIDDAGKHYDVGPDLTHDEWMRARGPFADGFKAVKKGWVRAHETTDNLSLQASGNSSKQISMLRKLASKAIKEGKIVFADLGDKSYSLVNLKDIKTLWPR